MSGFNIRPATGEDFERFHGMPAPWTMRAIVVERDGEIIGFGGYYLRGGAAVAFSDVRNASRKEILKSARALVALLDTVKVPVVAEQDDTPTAALEHFGFRRVGDTDLFVR
jgi:hypothetical protein